MRNDWIQILLGLTFLILYLFLSAKTEMGTKFFMTQNQNCLAEIFNFLQISDNLATSGQPTSVQFQSIADCGYETVINLALPTSDGAISNEAEIVESLGMEYIAIPIVWDNPTMDDLEQFLQAMDKRQNQKIFVHCAKNMRVSAFVYLYRRLRLNCEHEQAIADLHKLWLPNEVWQKFIDSNVA